MLKIGLDLHGVVDHNPEFFSEFSKMIVDSGNELHILTGPTFENVKDLLVSCNIKYTHFYSIIEGETANGHKVNYDKKGDPWMDGEVWNRSKAKYCLEKSIDMHIDDTEEYGKHFKTPFTLYKSYKG